jgi:hypothetical protein
VLENCPGTVVEPISAHTTAAAAAGSSAKTTTSGSCSGSSSNSSSSSSSVILYGQSVGSGPTCYLASKRVCAGVVLHSPIMSGMRVLTVRCCNHRCFFTASSAAASTFISSYSIYTQWHLRIDTYRARHIVTRVSSHSTDI